ncbi:hypothetical protein F8M41_013919 [Gigaspora margarita]|uniref:MD-2-related lipid-recognition domain-containing protein n=1 Tax=Gigaspora margarita TaxID=4874 RepID=A0A8H4A077_GIGMA|nr:hypothetical protein F8M41_013919 [Gigaspora margarita]
MNGNLILVSIFLLLTTSFTVKANLDWTDCSFNAIDAPIMDATFFSPDPIGPAGTTLNVQVTQSLSKPTTRFTKLVIEFTSVKGYPIGYTRHPLDENINKIDDNFLAVVPQFLPANYLIKVSVIEVGLGGDKWNCILFHR